MSSDLNGFRTLLKLKKPTSRYAVFGIILAKELYDKSYSPDLDIGNLVYIKSFEDYDESLKFVECLMKIVPTVRLVILDAMTPYPVTLNPDPEKKVELNDEVWERMDSDFSAMMKRSEQSRVSEEPPKEIKEVKEETSLDELRTSFVNLSFNMGMIEENLKIVKAAYDGLKMRQKEFQELVTSHPEDLSHLEANVEQVYGQKDPSMLLRLKTFLRERDAAGIPRIVTDKYIPNLEGLYPLTPLELDSFSSPPDNGVVSGSPIHMNHEPTILIKKISPRDNPCCSHLVESPYLSPDPPIFSMDSAITEKFSYPSLSEALPPSMNPLNIPGLVEDRVETPELVEQQFFPPIPTLPAPPLPKSLISVCRLESNSPALNVKKCLSDEISLNPTTLPILSPPPPPFLPPIPPIPLISSPPLDLISSIPSVPSISSIPSIPSVSNIPSVPFIPPIPFIPSISPMSSIASDEPSTLNIPDYFKHSQATNRT